MKLQRPDRQPPERPSIELLEQEVQRVRYRRRYRSVLKSTLYALITGENGPSLRFHEKCGYRIRMRLPDCGRKFGRWLDLIWMEKPLKIGENPSAFPVSWLSIVQDVERFCNILDSLSLSFLKKI